jgi:Zn finger protein HypA/HybF involved in hydrogenase expression
MDISIIQGTVSSLKLAGDIAKSFLNLKTISEVQGKVIELQSVILSAQSSALEAQSHESAMIEQIRNLKEEIARVKAWEKEKQRYKLISPWSGTVLYALKKESSASEPAHWICAKCYEDRRKSILNPQKKVVGRYFSYVFVCPTCKSEYFSEEHWRQVAVPEYVSE